MADRVRRSIAPEAYSDHITLLRAFQGWEEAKGHGNERQYCWDHFLSSGTLKLISSMTEQFINLLRDIGFVGRDRKGLQLCNAQSANDKLIKAILVGGLYPSVAFVRHPHGESKPMSLEQYAETALPGRGFGKRPPKLQTREDGTVKLHPKSVLSDKVLRTLVCARNHRRLRISSRLLLISVSR